MDTLLEAIGIVLETYFGFGFPNACPIGDSLRTEIKVFGPGIWCVFMVKVFAVLCPLSLCFQQRS